MGARLLTEEETRAITRARINSREWWVFVVLAGYERFLSLIESRHYTGAASASFELFMVPGITVAFARKSLMSPVALARLAVEAGGGEFPPEVYERHDIIFPTNHPQRTALVQMFQDWVLGDGNQFFKGLWQPPRGSQ